MDRRDAYLYWAKRAALGCLRCNSNNSQIPLFKMTGAFSNQRAGVLTNSATMTLAQHTFHKGLRTSARFGTCMAQRPAHEITYSEHERTHVLTLRYRPIVKSAPKPAHLCCPDFSGLQKPSQEKAALDVGMPVRRPWCIFLSLNDVNVYTCFQ